MPREEILWAEKPVKGFTGWWKPSHLEGRLMMGARAWPAGTEQKSKLQVFGWECRDQEAARVFDLNRSGNLDTLDEVQALLDATVWPSGEYGLPGGQFTAKTPAQGEESTFIQIEGVTLEIRRIRRSFVFYKDVVAYPVQGWTWAWAIAEVAQPGTNSTGKGNGNGNGSGNSNGGSNQPTVTATPNPTKTSTPTQAPVVTATPAPTPAPDPQKDQVPADRVEQQMFDASTPMPAPRAEQPAAATPAPTSAPTPATSDNTGDHITLDVVVEPIGWTSNFEATQVVSTSSNEGGRHRGTTEADTASTVSNADAGSSFSISTSSSEVADANDHNPGLDECGPDPWD
jgi:hypothetical protein